MKPVLRDLQYRLRSATYNVIFKEKVSMRSLTVYQQSNSSVCLFGIQFYIMLTVQNMFRFSSFFLIIEDYKHSGYDFFPSFFDFYSLPFLLILMDG